MPMSLELGVKLMQVHLSGQCTVVQDVGYVGQLEGSSVLAFVCIAIFDFAEKRARRMWVSASMFRPLSSKTECSSNASRSAVYPASSIVAVSKL